MTPSKGCPLRLKAKKTLDLWIERDAAWRQIKQAVQLVTPEGELNTRARAEAAVAAVLPQLPDAEFASVRRPLQRPQMWAYLDEIQRKLAVLAVPAAGPEAAAVSEGVPAATPVDGAGRAAVQEAALQQEVLRRRPELLQGGSMAAASRRALLLVCAVVLAKAEGAGQQAVAGVRRALRSSWRASSLVECINSVVRMQQTRHRKLTQGLLDLKRLYWNSQPFRTGRRRGKSPLELLGVPWPKGVRWWEVLKWSPERLRQELSALNKAV